MSWPDPVRAIAAFIEQPRAEDFEPLVLRASAFQAERIPALRRLLARRGPAPPRSWRDVPAVPVQAFKTVPLHVAPALELFRSSGTTGERSVHHHPYPDLYRLAIDRSFPRWCPLPAPTPILALVPPRDVVPDSSLGFMADQLVRTRGSAVSAWAFGPDGVDGPRATDWVRTLPAESGPVLVFATAFALVEWLDDLRSPLRLPGGSVVLETGGFKGRVREISRPELLQRIEERLGVPAGRVLREYGMCELTSQLYSANLVGGDPELLVGPEWTRVRVLDPATLEDAPPGRPGLVAVVDLANVGSAVAVLTQDLGILETDGLRLVGRASGAELRGCSLTVEEMARGGEG